MKGKVIVQSPDEYMGLTKLYVFINGKTALILGRNEKREVTIEQESKLTVHIGMSETKPLTPARAPITIPDGKTTKIVCHRIVTNKLLGTYAVVPTVVSQTDYIEDVSQGEDGPQKAMERLKEKNGYKLTARELQLMALNARCVEGTALRAADGFNHIAATIRPDEKVAFCIATGPIYSKQHSLGTSAVVLTESRIVFAGSTSDFIKTVSSFSLDLARIDAVDMQAQIMAYDLMITASGEQIKCTFAATKDANGTHLLKEFINAVYDCKQAKKEVNQQTNIINQISAADELKKFKELLDMGVITQEEFDAKKKQLLGL